MACLFPLSVVGVLCEVMAEGEPSVIQMYSHEGGVTYRKPGSAPLRKLTVDLIKTYRKINEVCMYQCAYQLLSESVFCLIINSSPCCWIVYTCHVPT